MLINFDCSTHVPSFMSVFQRNINENKEGLRRLPSAPPNNTSNLQTPAAPVHEIFRRSGHLSHRGDVAGEDYGK